MKLNLFRFWVVLIVGFTLLPAAVLRADDARDGVARIVRLMGYGAGIHNFKNYLLRGRPEYHAAAKREFAQTLRLVSGLALSAEMESEDHRALAAIESVAQAYVQALDRIAERRKKGWRISDIDQAIVIDDEKAVAGLEVLRRKWEWSDFEEMEFQLGYGHAIHNFKNYVLRGDEEFHTEALKNLLNADLLIASQFNKPEMVNPQQAAQDLASAQSADADQKAVEEIARMLQRHRVALQSLERMTRAYRNNLVLIERLIAAKRSVQQIDLAVKIDDTPSKLGLDLLR